LGTSCSQNGSRQGISEIYHSLQDQSYFQYKVKYSIYHPNGQKKDSNLYGLVSLNRNTDSGISSAFFGLNKLNQLNYLQSIYLDNEWIFNLSSERFDLADSDIIVDSLHSPILLNPDVILQIANDSVRVSHYEIDKNQIEYIFELMQKPDQLRLVWSTEHEKITEIQYQYNVNSENSYSRKWDFEYLTKAEYAQLELEYKLQNQTAQQVYL
jgi:hypothetical protein